MNLRFNNTDKVYPSIDYNGGMIWVDKASYLHKIKAGEWVTDCKDVHRVEFDKFIENNTAFKIIAQTPDLQLKGVPVVEVETIDLKQEVLKFIKHWELYFSSPKVGQPPELQVLKDAVNKAAQSKGCYTEEQVLRAMKQSLGYAFKYKADENNFLMEILQSIQPEIVVETMNECTNVPCDGKNCNIIKVPITEIKNGRTYFKLKQ